MPTGSREPENYSIDDMMERLKRKTDADAEADGALVVRPDGSQAIRVRRRKRRSKQPLKERQKREQKQRFARLIAGFVAALLIAGTIAGGVIYANSRPFRNALTARIADSTGAEVEMRQFRMNPTGANADALVLAWPEGNPMESLAVRGLRAETSLKSFFGGPFGGEELMAAEAVLTLRRPLAGLPVRAESESDPTPIDFSRIAIHRLHIQAGEGMGNLPRMRDVEASFYPKVGSRGRPQLRLNGGNLNVPALAGLRLDRALIEFSSNEAELIVARMFQGEDEMGEFLLAGRLHTADDASPASLTVQLTDFQIGGLIGDSMGRMIRGRINSRGDEDNRRLVFPPGDPSAGVLEVPFGPAVGSALRFSGFNFLGELAILLADPWFEQPTFEEHITGVITRSGGVVEIRDLFFESRNRMALRGNLRQEANGRLSGRLEVGLASTMVAAAPTRRLDPVISGDSGGYRWIVLEIGGTANAPTDNFMALVDNPPPSSGGTSFEDLTRPR